MSSLYDAVGGSPVFTKMVNVFYDEVEHDPVLRPLYPGDLGPARERLRMFFEQYWGGPTSYSEVRGHPRLRRRHAAWQIGERERDAWLRHMLAAIASLDLADPYRSAIQAHVEQAAQTLVNHHEPL